MFLLRLLKLQVKESNEGLFLIWKCPRCEDLRNYELIVGKGNYSLVGFTFSRPVTLLDLRCSVCRFELSVAPAEMNLLTQARDQTQLLISGNLSAESYQTAIRRLPARFVKELVSLTANWTCRKCGELNPVTFDSCWNCQSKENSASAQLSDEAKPFPGFPRGGHPWE
jgi:hypothetical protein